MRKYGLTLSLVIGVGMLLVSGGANAVPESNDAIRVSPAISNVQLQQSQMSTSVTALVTNLTDVSLAVALSPKDFGALNETGAVGFYGSGYDPGTNPHSLQSVMSFPEQTVYLAPHATQKVDIDLTNLGSLAAGGHFGAVLFTPESPVANNSRTNVDIHSSVASLVFLATANGGTQSLQLLTFQVPGISFSLPSLTYVGFHNSGNTQSSVDGQLTLFGPNGKIVSTAVINPGSGLVLPGTSRVFPVTLPLPHKFFAMPGTYRMRLQYQDSQTGLTTVYASFFYINVVVLGSIVLLVIIAIYIVKKHRKTVLKTCYRVAWKLSRVLKKGAPPAAPTPPKKRKPPLIQG